MTDSSETNNQNDTLTCQRIINGLTCGNKIIYSKNKCINCINKCSYVDKNGTTCSELIHGIMLNSHYCQYHYHVVNNIKQYKYWKQAVEYHKKYEYIGRHWEKAYKDGVDWIYHYVDRERLHNKTVDEIDPNDYDDEIWITDPIWSYSGPNYKDKLEKFGYSENYLEEQEKMGICNPQSQSPD